MSMYLHTPVLEVGSWWRVDTASGSDTATTVYAHDGTDAIPTGLGASGSTVRGNTRDGTGLFWSSAATLYCKELTYQGVPNGTVVTSTGATPTTPGAAGTGGPVLGGPNVWTGTQDFTGATVTGAGGGGAAALLDRGNWATSTVYAVGDVTTQTGQRYAARVAHTSGTFATDLAASKWVSLDAVAAATSARQITAGTGLTGGGDLSADRTLAVSYGTTSGTAAQGNDSRITGALQAANNLSDVTAASARTNLGLGTAAVISATAGGDLSGTLPSPTVAKVNGVTVSGTPSAGYVPTATSSTTATWQAPVVDGPSGITLNHTWDAQRSAYNLRPTNFGKWRKALAGVRAGTADAKLLIVGDSTTSGNGVNLFASAYPARLTTLLNSYVATARIDSTFGDGKTAVAMNTFDPRVTLGTGWTVVGSGSTAIGYAGGWGASNTASGTLSFTPVGSFDRIRVLVAQHTGKGTSTINVDGGSSLGNIVGAGSDVIGSTTFSCTAGTHTINISAPASSDIIILGIEAWSSTATSIRCYNGGVSAAVVGTYTATAALLANAQWDPYYMWPALAPDLTIVNLTINDNGSTAVAGTPTATNTYTSRLTTIINRAKETGDCLLVVGNPGTLGGGNETQAATYQGICYSLADSLGCGLIDLRDRWTSFTVGNALGFYADTVHPSSTGYADIADSLLNALSAA